jgi:transposase
VVFPNCLLIRRSHAGCSLAPIAAFRGWSADPLTRVRRLYCQGGLDALPPRDSPGRPRRATADFRSRLRPAVQTGPLQGGDGFAPWSSARRAEHRATPSGLRCSDDPRRRRLKQEGFSFQRPKHPLKGKRDEAASARAKQQLHDRKKKALGSAAHSALVFPDEVEIPKVPALARMGAEVGRQPEGPTPGQNEKRVVYGSLDYLSGKIPDTVAATKSGVNFLAFRVARVAAYAGQKGLLVCENGRFHTTQGGRAWLEANRDTGEIYVLPPSGPSLTLSERLWGPRNRTVRAHVLFGPRDDLAAAARRGRDASNGQRPRRSFVFNPDDILGKTTKKAG